MSIQLTDRMLGFAIACGAVVLGFTAWTDYPFEAALFPVIVLMLIAAAAAVLFVANGSAWSSAESTQPTLPSAALRVGLVLVSAAIAIPWLGFYVSCLAAMIAAPIASVGRLPKPSELAVDAGYGFVTVLIVYLTFEVWLKVQPPHGLLY